jgi:hypothetical protein
MVDRVSHTWRTGWRDRFTFARAYLTKRGEHLATKHDLDDLQEQLAGNEQIRSYFAELGKQLATKDNLSELQEQLAQNEQIRSYFAELGKHLATKHDLSELQEQLAQNTKITTEITETWKTRAHQLERRLSEFYWPLYTRLMRDDVVWRKVFLDLRPSHDHEQPDHEQPDHEQPDHEQPDWAKNLTDEDRRKLSQEIESKVLLPNHVEAVSIIRSSIHLANADAEFLELLAKYVRHVDAYTSLRSAGLMDTDPIAIGEPYPLGLSKAVNVRLNRYQADYDELVREKGVADFRKDIVTEMTNELEFARPLRARRLG